MKRQLAIALSALLVLWVAFLYWGRQPSPGPQPIPGAGLAPPEPAAARAAAPPGTAAPAEAPAPSTPPQAQAAPGPTPPREVPASDPETLAEIKSAYAGSSRDQRAGAVESDLRAAFAESGTPGDMLRSLNCHAAACKIEMNWSPERAQTFTLIALRWSARYGAKLAVEPAAMDATGVVPVTLYLSRARDPEAPPAAP